MKNPTQKILYIDFELQPITELLGLESPPIPRANPFKQINYINEYLRTLNCKSVVLEEHYIDRHYMEDHSIFYSRSFYQFDNSCRRLHFFNLPPEEVKETFASLVQVGRESGRTVYEDGCKRFSYRHYLGFSVIKPLRGSPVGRTVLLHPQLEDDANGLTPSFEPTREYRVHAAGIALSVRGLAFQQQDVGVSACATTALWTSLQKAKTFEQIRTATPAQITMLASQYTLPFGRPMPSEGLSIDQMCQATQALGIPPTLLRTTEFATARGHLYSAIASGFAPILILKSKNRYHAVTVVGMKVNSSADPVLIADNVDDRSRVLEELYIHDDRIGPYVPAKLKGKGDDINITLENGEAWEVTHILIPLHSKIRLSLAAARDIALAIVKTVHSFRESVIEPAHKINNLDLSFRTTILRSYEYTEKLFTGPERISNESFEEFVNNVSLPRYVTLLQICSSYFGKIDIVLDSTSTRRNLNVLGVIKRGDPADFSELVTQFISDQCDCDVY